MADLPGDYRTRQERCPSQLLQAPNSVVYYTKTKDDVLLFATSYTTSEMKFGLKSHPSLQKQKLMANW